MQPGIDIVDWIWVGMTMFALISVITAVGYAAVAAALRQPRHKPSLHRPPKHA